MPQELLTYKSRHDICDVAVISRYASSHYAVTGAYATCLTTSLHTLRRYHAFTYDTRCAIRCCATIAAIAASYCYVAAKTAQRAVQSTAQTASLIVAPLLRDIERCRERVILSAGGARCFIDAFASYRRCNLFWRFSRHAHFTVVTC